VNRFTEDEEEEGVSGDGDDSEYTGDDESDSASSTSNSAGKKRKKKKKDPVKGKGAAGAGQEAAGAAGAAARGGRGPGRGRGGVAGRGAATDKTEKKQAQPRAPRARKAKAARHEAAPDGAEAEAAPDGGEAEAAAAGPEGRAAAARGLVKEMRDEERTGTGSIRQLKSAADAGYIGQRTLADGFFRGNDEHLREAVGPAARNELIAQKSGLRFNSDLALAWAEAVGQKTCNLVPPDAEADAEAAAAYNAAVAAVKKHNDDIAAKFAKALEENKFNTIITDIVSASAVIKDDIKKVLAAIVECAGGYLPASANGTIYTRKSGLAVIAIMLLQSKAGFHFKNIKNNPNAIDFWDLTVRLYANVTSAVLPSPDFEEFVPNEADEVGDIMTKYGIKVQYYFPGKMTLNT
jgi:hypothetical protein